MYTFHHDAFSRTSTGRKMKDPREFHVVNYFDVWGKAKDGFEVNNLCLESYTITVDMALEGDHFRRQIMTGLKRHDFFKPSVRLASWRIDWNSSDDTHIEIEQTKDGMPVCRLEAVRDGD